MSLRVELGRCSHSLQLGMDNSADCRAVLAERCIDSGCADFAREVKKCID